MDKYQKIKNVVLENPVYFRELTDEYDKMKIGRPYTVQIMIEDMYWKACAEKIEADSLMRHLMDKLYIDESKKHYSVYDSSCLLS